MEVGGRTPRTPGARIECVARAAASRREGEHRRTGHGSARRAHPGENPVVFTVDAASERLGAPKRNPEVVAAERPRDERRRGRHLERWGPDRVPPEQNHVRVVRNDSARSHERRAPRLAPHWYFADEVDEYADSVQASLSHIEAAVPCLWPLEVTNTLAVAERRGRSTVAQATTWLALLQGLPIRVDGETISHVWTDTLHIARTHTLTTYDASYLELALRLGLPMATLDGKLKAAATDAGVPLYQVSASWAIWTNPHQRRRQSRWECVRHSG